MKLVTFSSGSHERRIGIMTDDGVIDIHKANPDAPLTMMALAGAWDQWRAEIERVARRQPDVRTAKLHAPVPRPGKVLAIGLNYADHIEESGMKMPEHQIWFCKMPTSVAGPSEDIQMPKVSTALDYEAELVVVIGKGGRHISKANAKDAIFGYCAGNDVTVRDWQFRTPQWMLGKSFDTHAPFGPWIVTPDEVGDPHALGIRAFVNGEKRQESNTKHLVFNVYDQIEHLSQAMTLEPGDIIFTGTPAGVGAAMKPPAWLKIGDFVRIEIDKIGSIDNMVAAEGK